MMRKPLKLKWGKKSGRYDLSQEIYVLTISIGDSPILQCTLTTDSTASQCVEYLSQKVDLNQVEMFGLRYQMKTNDPDHRMMRWVDLDKPLRRQLEKWACKPRQVQLAVLYHTPNVFTLTDQMARSYYFALMKLDVVEGRLTVTLEKYINLAAYSLQVDYGDHDPSIHTIEWLQSIYHTLLPKHVCRNAQITDDLLNRVSAVYERLRGMQKTYAALLYIVDAQQCEGYGEEYFSCRDEDSTEVNIGYSQEGIVVKGDYNAPIKYRWAELRDIHATKRQLNVRCYSGAAAQFQMEDAEMARYVAMLFNWQYHYAMNQAIIEKNYPMNINNLQGSIRPFIQQITRSPNVEINTGTINNERTTANATISDQNCKSTIQQQQPSSTAATSSKQADRIQMAVSMCNIPLVCAGDESQIPVPNSASLSYKNLIEVGINGRHRTSSSSGTLSLHDDPISMKQPKNSSSNPVAAPNYTKSPTCRPPPYPQPLRTQLTGSSPEIHMIGTGKGRNGGVPVYKHYSVARLVNPTNSVQNFLDISSTMKDDHRRATTNKDNNCSSEPPKEQSVQWRTVRNNNENGGITTEDTSSGRFWPNGIVQHQNYDVMSNGDQEIKPNDGTLASIIAKLSTEDAIDEEFTRIPNKRMSAGTSTSQKPENMKRNRTRSIVPYEDTRITLHSSKSNPTGYINASYLQVPVAGHMLRYIISQAPLRDTVDEFWQMVWESGSQLIIMLSDAQDGQNSSTPVYWPQKVKNKMNFGNYTVSMSSSSSSAHQSTSILLMEHPRSGEQRVVYHMRLHNWPSGDIPPGEEIFLGFIDAVNSVKRHLDNERIKKYDSQVPTFSCNGISDRQPRSQSMSRTNLLDITVRSRSNSMDDIPWKKRLQFVGHGRTRKSSPSNSDSSSGGPTSSSALEGFPGESSPAIVHCVSGAHESGVYLLVEVLIHCLEHNLDVDISKTLSMLRQQRMCLIKTIEQYRFVYSTIACYLQKSRLI